MNKVIKIELFPNIVCMDYSLLLSYATLAVNVRSRCLQIAGFLNNTMIPVLKREVYYRYSRWKAYVVEFEILEYLENTRCQNQ